MISGMSIGYVQFTILLLLMTGGAILRFDVKSYSLNQQVKETKAARFMGWFNISLGGVVFIGNWIYKTFLW